jgi:hypothetical protein
MDANGHTEVGPLMALGSGLTVIGRVIRQVVGKVYVITVVPTPTPVTTPPPVIVAIAVLPLVHAPPPVASLSEIVAPKHNSLRPDIAAGNGFTVTTVVM